MAGAASPHEAPPVAAAGERRAAVGTRDRVAAVVGVAAGVVIASVDSRPGWDDTGVTAVALAIAAAVTAAVSGRRPWLWALVIAAWVPALEVRSLASGGPFLAVVFAGAGAAVGWLVVRGGR